MFAYASDTPGAKRSKKLKSIDLHLGSIIFYVCLYS